MAIRSAARGLVLDGGTVLLARFVDGNGRVTYVLPGGGQELYEPLVEAMAREMREESGYEVTVGKLVAVCEQIFLSEQIREKHPDYAHRMHHIFLCALKGDARGKAMKLDFGQEKCVWMPLAEADKLDNLFPMAIRGRIEKLAKGETCEFLGCEFVSD